MEASVVDVTLTIAVLSRPCQKFVELRQFTWFQLHPSAPRFLISKRYAVEGVSLKPIHESIVSAECSGLHTSKVESVSALVNRRKNAVE